MGGAPVLLIYTTWLDLEISFSHWKQRGTIVIYPTVLRFFTVQNLVKYPYLFRRHSFWNNNNHAPCRQIESYLRDLSVAEIPNKKLRSIDFNDSLN